MDRKTSQPLILKSFKAPINAAVVGSTGGIGSALAEQLQASPTVNRLFPLSRTGLTSQVDVQSSIRIDLEDENSIAAAAEAVKRRAEDLRLVIVATGILHDGDGMRPEKTWRLLDGDAMDKAFRVNTIGPSLLAKHFLPLLARDGKAVFAAVSARVGSIADNRLGGWYAYRASKAALNMMIKTLSIELARRNPEALCVGLHPGTVDTALSRPFQGGVPKGELFSPTRSARHLLEVIDGLGARDMGQMFAWDGERVPF